LATFVWSEPHAARARHWESTLLSRRRFTRLRLWPLPKSVHLWLTHALGAGRLRDDISVLAAITAIQQDRECQPCIGRSTEADISDSELVGLLVNGATGGLAKIGQNTQERVSKIGRRGFQLWMTRRALRPFAATVSVSPTGRALPVSALNGSPEAICNR
jgi:hypothetical protein